MRIYTCAPTPPVPRPAWASAAGSRATTPPGPIRHSAIGRPMRSTNHRRSRGLLRHRSVWQHDRHYSPQGDRPELRSLSRLSKLGGPAQNHLSKSVVRENRTPRSVGTGGGRPLPVTRCGGGNIPAYSAQGVLENVELAGVIRHDDGVGEQGDDRPDHGRLGDPPTMTGAEVETVQVPRRLVGKTPALVAEQA